MKCGYCGGALSLEDERCPHCGQLNQHAQKHIADMRKYKGEFEHTKNYVYEKTRLYTQITVRMIILAVLAILTVGLYVLRDNAYSISRDWVRSDAAKRYEQYSKELDGYLAEENFRAFSSFCEAHRLDSYEGKYAPKYGRVIRVVNSYIYLYDSLIKYAFPESDITIEQAKLTADDMSYFYRNLDYTPGYGVEDENDPAVTKAIETMVDNVERFLMTYCGFTQEEAESMRELSEARRIVMLEEKLEGRLQDGE